MISIQSHHCPSKGKQRRRIHLEYAGLAGIAVWFTIAYFLFHR
jgi:hypothetical protein